MRRGSVTPDTMGMIVAMVGMILLGFLMFIKTTKQFEESFVATSSKVVAMDMASLMSLAMAAKEARIEYKTPAETVSFEIGVNNGYLSVKRIDETYCKEEEQSLIEKIQFEEPVYKQSFCIASSPLIHDYNIVSNVGRKFTIEKIDSDANVRVE